MNKTNKTIREFEGVQDVNADIEKAYPEAYRLARKFHELYEEIAPKFGYETRGDTKAFEPASPNGRTMAYVCKEIIDEEIEKALLTQLQEIEDVVEGKKLYIPDVVKLHEPEGWKGELRANAYNLALSDLLQALKEKKDNLK